MIEEKIEEFMSKVTIINKELSQYKNDEKGLIYPLSTAQLLTRVDYLELTKDELQKAKFEMKVDKKEYKMYDCTRLVPKYSITKVEKDKYTITEKKVKATHIWNVTNQAGIHTTFEDKEEAFKLCESINNKIYEAFN